MSLLKFLDIPTPVFKRYFVITARYFDVLICYNIHQLNGNNVYDILEAADMFLLPTLKRECGNFLAEFAMEVDTVVTLVLTSRLFDLPRLEHQCTKFMANNIETVNNCNYHTILLISFDSCTDYFIQMISRDDFKDLVISDAHSIKDRQETDTIDIVDEIRYFLKTDLNSMAALEEAQTNVEILDEFLADLGFEI